MPKVSIIVPIYNTEEYLSKCLDSLIHQTLKDIEIICINDASTDNSLALLNRYAEQDSRIKTINFQENNGVSIARNSGIKSAIGEYIGFVDSDDFVDLDFYENLYNTAKKTQADAVKGNIYDYDSTNQTYVLTDFYNMNDKIKKNKAYFYYGFTSAIYKASFIRKHHVNFPENISHFEDPYFSIKASLYYSKLEIVNDASYYYTKRDDSVCSSYTSHNGAKSFIEGITAIFGMINQSDMSQEDYLIRIVFLLEQIIPFCKSGTYSTIMTKELAQTLSNILENSKLPIDEVLSTYFIAQKSNLIRKNLRILRKTKGEIKCPKE